MRSNPSGERRENRREPRERGVCALLSSLMLASACSTSNVDVSGDDDSAFSASGRLSWSLDRGTGAPDEGTPGEDESATFSLNLDVSHGAGSGAQRLLPGQSVEVGNQTFEGPDDLQVDFGLTRVLFDVRAVQPLSDGFSAEFFGGLEYSSMQVDVRSGSLYTGVVGSNDVASYGPTIGMAFIWQPVDALRFSAEGRLGAGLTSGGGMVELTSIEVGVGVFPLEEVGLFLGWRTVSYEAEVSGFDSDLDLELAGPLLALWFRF